ncbi:IS1/IS1595 family N-terminal zinc-binding domain-containing protein [Amedibacillus sp. YH-ame10]
MNKIAIEDLKCISAKELHELQLTINNLVKEKLVNESMLLAHCDQDVLCCPHCNSHKIIKYGTNKQGKQRYQCKNEDC